MSLNNRSIAPRQIFISTSTTGLSVKEGDRLVEIACYVLATGETFHTYLNPNRDSHPDALKLHELTTSFLSDQPTFAQKAAEFLSFIRDADLFFYNKPFHTQFMNAELKLVGLKSIMNYCKSITNTADLAKNVVNTYGIYSLASLCEYYGVVPPTTMPALKGAQLNTYLLSQVYAHLIDQSKQAVRKEVKEDHLYARSITEDNFVESDKKIQPFKTSLMLNQKYIKLGNTEELEADLAAIPSYRPVAEVKEVSRAGSPVTVSTPKNSRLHRVARFGAFSLFSNFSEATPVVDNEPVMNIANEKDFFASPQYQAIKKIIATSKGSQAVITTELLQEIHDAKHAMETERGNVLNQPAAKIMLEEGHRLDHARATDYVNATQSFSGNMRWEWLRNFTKSIMGTEAQEWDNIVASTVNGNTNKLFADAELAYLAEKYPQGFDLKIECRLIYKTHIAKEISYTIETPDFTLPLVFDPQTGNRPHISTRDYFHSIVKALVAASKQQSNQVSSSSTEGRASTLFYNKRELLKDKTVTEIVSQFRK